jgi:hypothetical protein
VNSLETSCVSVSVVRKEIHLVGVTVIPYIRGGLIRSLYVCCARGMLSIYAPSWTSTGSASSYASITLGPAAATLPGSVESLERLQRATDWSTGNSRGRRRAAGQGQRKGDPGSPVSLAIATVDSSPVDSDDFAAQVQADPGSLRHSPVRPSLAQRGVFDAEEFLEDTPTILGRDTRPGIDYGQPPGTRPVPTTLIPSSWSSLLNAGAARRP